MGVENEILQLRPNCFELDVNSSWVMVRRWSNGAVERSEVPESFWPLLALQARGISLAGMANWLRGADIGSGRFRLLKEFLNYLYEHDLLLGQKAIDLAEGLRADSTWSESAAFSTLISFELFRVGPRRTPSRVAQLTYFVVLSMAVVAVTVCLLQPFLLNTGTLTSLWPLLVALLFSFSVGRSARALAQFANVQILSGFAVSLHLRLDFFSLSLATDDVSLVRQPQQLYVVGSCLAMAFLAAPVLLLHFLPGEVAAYIGGGSCVGFFTGLLFLADFSPFRASPVTECLRTWYSLLDRRNRQAPQNQTVEALLNNIHKFSCGLWVAGLTGFLLFPLRHFVHRLAVLERTPKFVLLFLVSAILLSLVVDAVLSLSEASGDLSVFRRLWRRRPSAGSVIDSASPSAEELERLPLIRQMDPKIRDVLLSDDNARVVDVDEGQAVVRQGHTDRRLFVVLSGRLAVYKRVANGRNRLVTYLEPGAVFGEVSFFFGAPRTASVKAIEGARVLVIRHDDRIADLDASRSSELQLRIWFLAAMTKSGWFKELPAEAMDALVFSGQRFEIRSGQKVISEGERGDSCYFIIEGQASTIQNFKVLNRLRPGDVFGEIALMQPGLLRTATVVADTDLLTVKLDGERFWSLLCTHLPLAIELEKLSEARLRADIQRQQAAS